MVVSVLRNADTIIVHTRQELLDWIYMEDFESRHKAVRSKRVADSGVWFLKHPIFDTWTSGESPNNLFCPGLGISKYFARLKLIVAGAGKTVMS
jgi:hypothetical protein